MSEDKKRFKNGRSGESKGDKEVAMGRHWAKIANNPLKKQHTGDAWNERQNRLAASRDSAKMLMKGTMTKNKEKSAAAERAKRKK